MINGQAALPRLEPRAAPPDSVTARIAADLAARRATITLRWAYVFTAIGVIAALSSFVIGFKQALSLLVIVGFGAALAGLYHPVVGLYGVGMLCTLDAMTRVFLMSGGWLRWNTFNYVLLFVSMLNVRLLFSVRSGQLRILHILAVVLLAGLLITQDMTRGTYDVLAFLSLFGLFAYFVRGGTSPEAWWGLALVTGSLGAVMGFAFFRQSAFLSYIDPNAWIAGPVSGLFAICLGFPSGRTPRAKAVLIVLAVMNATWVFLSGSRGGLLTSLCCLGFLLITVRGLHRRLVAVGVAAIVILAVASQFGDLQERTLYRVQKLIDPNLTLENRTSKRSDLLLGGLLLFVEHPVTGVGTGGFVPAWMALRGSREMSSFDSASGKIAHSGWVKMLAENGVAGGVVFTLFVLSFAGMGLRHRNRERRLLGLFVTVALTSVFLTQEFQAKAQWFLTAGAMVLLNTRAITAYRLAQRRARRARQPLRVSPRP